jgi:hypothetical protein
MALHKDMVTIGMHSAGRLTMESILGTKAATLLHFVRGLRGNLLVAFGTGTNMEDA